MITALLAASAALAAGFLAGSRLPRRRPEVRQAPMPVIVPHHIWRARLYVALEYVTLEHPFLPDGWEDGTLTSRPARGWRTYSNANW